MRKIKINKKLIIILTLVLVLVPATAHAASIDISGAIETFLQNLAAFLQTTLQLLQKLLWPVLLMIGGLLGNDLLFSAGMEERLLSIWVQVRNFVNIGFVVILVGLALINVLGIESEKFSLKSILPKFIIGLIAVNFSYVAMKIVLDVTNVLTVAIFAMPNSIEENLGKTKLIPTLDEIEGPRAPGEYVDKMDEEQRKKMLSICRNFFGEAKDYKPPKADPNNPTAEELCSVVSGSWEYTDSGINYFNKFNSRNAAMILAIQMMNINQLDEVSNVFVEEKDSKGKVTKVSFDMKKLTFNLLFNTILYVVYGSAYLALLAVLLTRLVVLWVLIAISPVFAIQLVLPNLIGSGGDMKEKFMNNTFAPIMIAIPLTLGYMMLDAYKYFNPASSDTGAVKILSSSAKSLQIDASGIGDLQRLVMAVAAVAVVWMGVFIYAGKSMAGPLTDFIKNKVQGFGGRVVGLARYVPLIPGKGGGKKLTIAETMALAERPLYQLEQKGQGDANKMLMGTSVTARDVGSIRTHEGAKPVLSKAMPIMHRKDYQQALAGAFKNIRNTTEQNKFLTPAAKGILGVASWDELVKKLQAGDKLNADQIRRWFSSIGVSGTAGGGKTTGPRGKATAGTAAPLSTVNRTLASSHGLGARNGGRSLKNEELKIAVDGNGTELNAVSTAVKNYDKTKAGTVAALKTALAAYSRKLKGKKTKDGKAFTKAKECVDDVLKKASKTHSKDYGDMSKHIPS
ncbi:hypothetical protein ACFL3C_03415 [Patescibacteria group bacterium]